MCIVTGGYFSEQAYFARDALSKHIYSRLFDWIVRELNKSLVSSSSKKKFIGVLDIYGCALFAVEAKQTH